MGPLSTMALVTAILAVAVKDRVAMLSLGSIALILAAYVGLTA